MTGKKITRTELIKCVAKQSGESRAIVRETLHTFLALVSEKLEKQKSVRFRSVEKSRGHGHYTKPKFALEFFFNNKKRLSVRLRKQK